MIRGAYRERDGYLRPYLTCDLEFPDVPRTRKIRVPLLVDTGSDKTTISLPLAESAGLIPATLPDAGTSTGVGGVTAARQVLTRLSVQGHTSTFWLRIRESRHTIPPVLGRDFMVDLALFMEERTGSVLFLEPEEVARLHLPGAPAIP